MSDSNSEAEQLMRTPWCDTLGIDVPIVQAPVGSAAPELAAAVSHAGGLGMLALTWQSPARALHSIRQVRESTSRPFGANLVLAFSVDELLGVCLDAGVPVIEYLRGNPRLQLWGGNGFPAEQDRESRFAAMADSASYPWGAGEQMC